MGQIGPDKALPGGGGQPDQRFRLVRGGLHRGGRAGGPGPGQTRQHQVCQGKKQVQLFLCAALSCGFGQFEGTGAVKAGQRRQERHQFGINLHPAQQRQAQRAAHRPARKFGQRRGITTERNAGLVKCRGHVIGRQRAQPQGATARSDRRQQA